MRRFFKDIEKSLNLKDLDPNRLMYRVMPQVLAEIMTKYFRMKIEGLHNIPKKGAALITPNHSGYSGFDAFLLGHHIYKGTNRAPRILTHKLWFATESLAKPMRKLGFIEATKKNGLKALDKKQLLILFPEGEQGNFKPSTRAYHMQEFKTGFVRMAIEKQCPIIPTLILGAEETHINLAKLKLPSWLKGAIVPLPFNILPLPAKWHIIFMDPIILPYEPHKSKDAELVHELCVELREIMQERLSYEVSRRKNLYF